MAFQFDSRRYPVTDIIEEAEMTEAFALFERNPQRVRPSPSYRSQALYMYLLGLVF